MKHCFHDRVREGCADCDRLRLEQRAAAMVVLGLDAEDLDIAEQARELRRRARAAGVPSSLMTKVLLGDEESARIFELLRELRRVAATDPGAADERPAVERIRALGEYARTVAGGHRDRASSTGGLDRGAHERARATWQAEADLLDGLLELLGHTPSVTRKPKGDQA